MPPALPVHTTPSSCSALVRCLTEGVVLLTRAIASVLDPKGLSSGFVDRDHVRVRRARQGARPSSVFGPVAAET